MGQELIKRANVKATPLWSAQVMLEQPALVRDLHLDFINAGAKVITLNNYTATPGRLARDASIDLLAPLHQAAISAAQSAIELSGDNDIRIAGCLPPLMASYTADAALDFNTSLTHYQQLVELQRTAVDVFICETMASISEATAAVTAAKTANKPVWVSFVLHDQLAQLPSGESLVDAIDAIQYLGVDAVLVNCCALETINKTLPSLVAHFPVTGVYANAFVDVEPLKPGGTVDCLEERDDISPSMYAKQCLSWVQDGVSIVGGCCAIGPSHIKAINQLLTDNHIKVVSDLDH